MESTLRPMNEAQSTLGPKALAAHTLVVGVAGAVDAGQFLMVVKSGFFSCK